MNLKKKLEQARSQHIDTYKQQVVDYLVSCAGERYKAVCLDTDAIYNSALTYTEKGNIIRAICKDNDLPYEKTSNQTYKITLVEE